MEKDKKTQNKVIETLVKQDLLIWTLTDSILDTLHLIEKGIGKET